MEGDQETVTTATDLSTSEKKCQHWNMEDVRFVNKTTKLLKKRASDW